ncbi:NADPH-dependent FMN reductase [Paenibacillus montanisoli]|uniref:NADPH-dependent FMN reductase n=1 Tax=Paenibacillus montanisoli TaxID=2081970 RepID=A0A328TYJ2_9BACL|nr:NADPH-dependent FMN reductase [Paenibacillus montanisoli]RAP75539.1 NADPH-dependent FMN reductase [Paenibacillus montanisoli]
MRIAIIAGSNRAHSTSTMLSRYIGKVIESEGHEVTLFDLHVRPLPFYGSHEEADPQVAALKEAALHSDAIVLSTPEYHGSMSGVLKNALDFLGGDQFDSKAVLSVSSAGGAVGVSSLTQMQAIVRNMHGINCPEWISIGGASRQFDEDGTPSSADVKNRVHRTVPYFLKLAAKLRK